MDSIFELLEQVVDLKYLRQRRVMGCVGSLHRLVFVALFGLLIQNPTASASILEHYVARAVSQVTTTSAGWSNITGSADSGTAASTNGWIDNSNFTVGERYLVMCWGFYNCDNANANCGMRVTHAGTAFSESQSMLEPQQIAATYKHPYFWFTVWTAADEDLEVQMYRGANTARVEDITLVAINAESLITNNNLQYSINTTGGTTNNTLATKVSTTWTPANNGDTWLVMAYSLFNVNDVGGNTYEQRLVLGGTNMTTSVMDGEDTNDTVVVPSAFARTFTNASTTIALQLRSGNNSHAWLAAGIFALRLNAFESFVINATSGTTVLNAGNNTYNTVATVTSAPRLTSDWIVTGGFVDDDNNSFTTARIQLDNTTDISSEQGGQAWVSTDLVPFIAGDITSYEARVSHTWDLDARETNNTTNPEAEDAWLAAFSLSFFDRIRLNTVIDH